MKNKKKILILVIIICLIGYIIMLFASQPSFVNKFYIRPIGEDDTMSLYLDMHNNAGFYSYEDESALGDSYKCNKYVYNPITKKIIFLCKNFPFFKSVKILKYEEENGILVLKNGKEKILLYDDLERGYLNVFDTYDEFDFFEHEVGSLGYYRDSKECSEKMFVFGSAFRVDTNCKDSIFYQNDCYLAIYNSLENNLKFACLNSKNEYITPELDIISYSKNHLEIKNNNKIVRYVPEYSEVKTYKDQKVENVFNEDGYITTSSNQRCEEGYEDFCNYTCDFYENKNAVCINRNGESISGTYKMYEKYDGSEYKVKLNINDTIYVMSLNKY